MLRKLTAKSARMAVGSALAGLLLLTACDQQSERLERAQELADATLDQISGRKVVEPKPKSAMDAAKVEDRAIAGSIQNDLAFQTAGAEPLFAIGSIIAKPKDIVEVSVGEMAEDEAFFAEEMPLEAAPESIEGSSQPRTRSLERSIALPEARISRRVTLDPRNREQTLQNIERASQAMRMTAMDQVSQIEEVKSEDAPRTRSLGVPAPSIAPKKMARRSVISRSAIVRQRDANSVMLDVLSKYDMGGEVELSREGAMVMQIGSQAASPTQFRPQAVPRKAKYLEFMAKHHKKECSGDLDVATISQDEELATACIVKELRESGQFEYVEKDFIFENQFARRPRDNDPTTSNGVGNPSVGPAMTTPNDPLWDLQWHFQNNGSGDGETAGGASFQDFWTRQGIEGSDEVVVAVVDTGLQLQHPDIKDSPNVMDGWDMVSDPRMGNDGDGRDNDPNDPGDLCDPSVPGATDTFHGTHVAGTIGAVASDNGSGVAGGAWKVKIVPVRALGKCGGRLSDINESIRWAGGLIPAEDDFGNEIWNDNPADIINLSIGLFEFCPASLQDAIDAVTERGVIVVAAAGNARVSTEFYAPAGCNNVITVAAGDARGQIAPYSNFGPEVDILAPGGDLARDDNGDGRPDGILSTKTSSNCYDPVTGEPVDDCFYAYEQGTSMAAPHVSAALALLKARDPDATASELIDALMATIDARDPLQCAGACSDYPGTTPIEGSGGMCLRPCGDGLLNLSNVPAPASEAGGR